MKRITQFAFVLFLASIIGCGGDTQTANNNSGNRDSGDGNVIDRISNRTNIDDDLNSNPRASRQPAGSGTWPLHPDHQCRRALRGAGPLVRGGQRRSGSGAAEHQPVLRAGLGRADWVHDRNSDTSGRFVSTVAQNPVSSLTPSAILRQYSDKLVWSR